MRYRNKFIFLILLVFLVIGLQLTLPGNPIAVEFYNNNIFRPYQTFRNMFLGHVPFSIGDILYLGIGIGIIISIAKWFYFLFKIKTHHHYLGHSLMRMLIFLSVVYVLFFIGWGGNYYKPKLTHFWELNTEHDDSKEVLALYDSILISRLNELSNHYHVLSFDQVDIRARNYYRDFTDSKTSLHGLNAKASIFGYMMQYLEIQGYYNPFTGEAQVNDYQPAFMMPFVVCHEMAHQSGIAAEDDANLLSFALCSEVPDTVFKYSAYFNLWLYTNARLRAIDSSLAKSFKEKLNPLSRAQLDTLKAIRKSYRSEVSDYSSKMYDQYLRLHDQKDGINSYNNVVLSAWAWEKKRMKKLDWLIRIP